jgi:hypothetical protein
MRWQKTSRREAQRAARKATWEHQRKDKQRVDVYGDNIPPGETAKPPVDGRRLSDDLRRLFALTGDPAFERANLVLRSYGLSAGKPTGSARRVRLEKVLSRGDFDALEDMTLIRAQARREGRQVSIRDAGEQVVSRHGLDGASFESAVDDLRRRYRQIERTGAFPGEDPRIGDTGRQIFVCPAGRGVPDHWTRELPDEGMRVPDTRHWRQIASWGYVLVRHLGEK